MAWGEGGDVVGVDRREHRDAQLVAPELAVRLGVDDGHWPAALLAIADAFDVVGEVDGCPLTWLRADGFWRTNGCANVLASAQP